MNTDEEVQSRIELTKALQSLLDNNYIKTEADRQRTLLSAWYAGYRNGMGFLFIDLLSSTEGDEWRVRDSQPFRHMTDEQLFTVGIGWMRTRPGYPQYSYEENAHYIIGFFQGVRKEWR